MIRVKNLTNHQNKIMKIVLTSGGTGGHLNPLIAVKKKIQEKEPEAEFLFLGPLGEMEKSFMEPEGIAMKKVMSGKMRRYFSWQNFFDMFKIPLGIVQALWHLLVYMPDAIFSKGGYASIPVVVAGWLYRIPILIHESDAKPGLANSMLAKFAERVAVSYYQAEINFPADQVVLTGNPIRTDIADGDPIKGRQLFNIANDKKIIFVWGGSQGAELINSYVVEILPMLLRNYNVIHQTGEKNFEKVKRMAGELGIKAGREGYYPVSFIREELKDILATCDLVISRAGSNSISEIAANKKPAIIIPLENSANGHQRMNAYAVAKVGGCVVLEEGNLGENMLLGEIGKIMNKEELRNVLSLKIQAFYHPNATEKIAEGVLGMIK
jgi:UDP-N-acetylglucosamine--N-acetylmuramyl-(pentapeptide) pyrophosphoryl-undecaprenol N-acetylglucosamine transferase